LRARRYRPPADDGRAMSGDRQLAERLIMALVDRLPADSALRVR
jgi:hypothetical protein